jgi:hypothetical protein
MKCGEQWKEGTTIGSVLPVLASQLPLLRQGFDGIGAHEPGPLYTRRRSAGILEVMVSAMVSHGASLKRKGPNTVRN